MQNSRSILRHLRVSTLAILAILVCSGVAHADRKVRIHFVAASFSYAQDGLGNSQLAGSSSSSGFDVVWDGTTPQNDDFPTFFDAPTVRNATGRSEQRVKFGNGNCSGNLTYDSTPTHQPSVGIYKRDGDLVAIKLAVPHASAVIRDFAAPSPCDAPFHINYADAPGVTTTYLPSDPVPNDAGSTSVPPHDVYAAFTLSAKNPGKTVSFSFVQTASFPDQSYQSKTVWFGTVTVEVNPSGQPPSPVDPQRLRNYVPPDAGQAPADPPAPTSDPGSGGGNTNVKPIDLKKFIKGSILDQLREGLESLQSAWNALTGGSPVFEEGALASGVLVSEPDKGYTFDTDTRKFTILSTSSVPSSGKLTVKIGLNGNNSTSALKTSVSADSTGSLVLTLPKALVKAIAKGSKSQLKVEGSYTVSKKLSATANTSFSLKKRKKGT